MYINYNCVKCKSKTTGGNVINTLVNIKVCSKNNIMGVASRSGTAYPFRAPKLIHPHLPVLCGVCVVKSLVSSVAFCTCIIVCPFFFGYCIACPSFIYGFWLSLWVLSSLYYELRFSCRNFNFDTLHSKLIFNFKRYIMRQGLASDCYLTPN